MTDTPATGNALDAIDELLARFLDSVSFDPGGRPDHDGIRPLFLDRGLLVRNIAGATEATSVEEFIAPRLELVSSGRLTAFREAELEASTTVFGAVAHRVSTYTKAGVQDGAPFEAQGVILTQLAETAGGWRIASMSWDDVRPGLDLADLRVFS